MSILSVLTDNCLIAPAPCRDGELVFQQEFTPRPNLNLYRCSLNLGLLVPLSAFEEDGSFSSPKHSPFSALTFKAFAQQALQWDRKWSMHGGKHPKLVQICTEFPTLIEPSVTHLRACASTHVDSFRAKWEHCMHTWTAAPGLLIVVLMRAQSCDAPEVHNKSMLVVQCCVHTLKHARFAATRKWEGSSSLLRA